MFTAGSYVRFYMPGLSHSLKSLYHHIPTITINMHYFICKNK